MASNVVREHIDGSPTPFEAQVRDFRLMADAGAVVVQGSQAHNPESLEFNGGSLIHYGLGNLFFDQMGDLSSPTRTEFIDRHVFYDGRYIGTELLTAELEDYARPRPMTPEERAAFLAKYFAASGW
jgi:poly-gamma-glutamate synthesis protein (capsule biosynthesis protein)